MQLKRLLVADTSYHAVHEQTRGYGTTLNNLCGLFCQVLSEVRVDKTSHDNSSYKISIDCMSRSARSVSDWYCLILIICKIFCLTNCYRIFLDEWDSLRLERNSQINVPSRTIFESNVFPDKRHVGVSEN